MTEPEIIQDVAEKVALIKRRLETAASRQKSYVDPKCRDVEFQVGEYVFLKVSPIKGVMRFGKKKKLVPRYIKPFEIGESWHGCLSVGFASKFIAGASSVPYLDA